MTVILISRDVVIVGVVAIVNLAIGPRTFRPSRWGKLATATYIVTSVVLMYFNWRAQPSILVDLMIWISLTVTVISAADYFLKLRRLVNEPEGT
jgi:phosphatidylglycerophosphate synthase